jgi:SAM-dependent methyltransferase
VRRGHFAAFAPHCPHCAGVGAGRHVLVLAEVRAERADEVISGILHCPNPSCQHEYPIIDGIPVIVPELRTLLAERGIELLLRDDIDPLLESLLGDAMGPGGWFDVMRQTASSYAWDGWADLDPDEPPAGDGPTGDGPTRGGPTGGGPVPGAVRRCLARLLDMAGPIDRVERALDIGCGAGRTAFTLAERHPRALVLGIDMNLGLLRLAHDAAHGTVSYPRRRIGLVYDRRCFAVSLIGVERVDFWACDALALPFAAASADLVAALNVLDCVAEPRRLLAGLAEVLRSDGRLLLATPYDWSTRATPVETWIGGHSQRAAHRGAAEPFLRALLSAGEHPQSVPGLRLLDEMQSWPWHTRLHDRSTVSYRSHLLALARSDG